MASDTTLPARAHIRQIRLFFSGGPHVGLYGSPSTVADGWIANLPADEVFAGDFTGLVYERLIDAQDAHERCPFHTPFYERHVHKEPEPEWPQQVPAAAAGSDPKLTSAALRHLNTARILASRLAREAQRDNRPEDQQRFLAAAADATLKAADLQSDAETASRLREQALRQLSGASTIAARLAQQARRNNQREHQQHFLAAAADSSLKAANHMRDADASAKLREQAHRQLIGALNIAARLAQQARREGRPHDQQQWLAAASDRALIASDLLKG